MVVWYKDKGWFIGCWMIDELYIFWITVGSVQGACTDYYNSHMDKWVIL